MTRTGKWPLALVLCVTLGVPSVGSAQVIMFPMVNPAQNMLLFGFVPGTCSAVAENPWEWLDQGPDTVVRKPGFPEAVMCGVTKRTHATLNFFGRTLDRAGLWWTRIWSTHKKNMQDGP